MTFFDRQSGALDRCVFACPRIFEQESETIFARNWLFVGPEASVNRPGDFYATRLGRHPMLLWRGEDRRLHLRPNRCDAGLAPLSRLDGGSALALRCSCHGRVHRPEAAARAVRLGVHRGLVFATEDPSAPPLAHWMAPYQWWFDLALDAMGARPVFYRGWLDWRLEANWKLAAQSYCGDHDRFGDDGFHPPRRGLQALTDAGVVVASFDDVAGASSQAGAEPRPITGTLFPNLSFDARLGALFLWQPLAPALTEVRSFLLVGEADSRDRREQRRRAWAQVVGPTGWLTGRQAQAWRAITQGSKGPIARRHQLTLDRGLGAERASNLPGRTVDLSSEAGQRAFYLWWERQLARDRLQVPLTLSVRPAARNPSAAADPGLQSPAEAR